MANDRSTNPKATLSSLPVELRLSILTYLVVFSDPIVFGEAFDMSTIIALFRTNKAMYSETTDLFFNNNIFLIADTQKHGKAFPPPLHSRFLSRVQFLEIFWPRELEQQFRAMRFGKLMEGLKRCTIRLDRYHSLAVSLKRYSETGTRDSFLAAFAKLQLPKACELVLYLESRSGNLELLRGKAVNIMHRIHQARGKDWAVILEKHTNERG